MHFSSGLEHDAFNKDFLFFQWFQSNWQMSFEEGGNWQIQFNKTFPHVSYDLSLELKHIHKSPLCCSRLFCSNPRPHFHCCYFKVTSLILFISKWMKCSDPHCWSVFWVKAKQFRKVLEAGYIHKADMTRWFCKVPQITYFLAWDVFKDARGKIRIFNEIIKMKITQIVMFRCNTI